ncbi:MAG: oligosaccharide flippase family protein, partial [Chitinophagales bacterium]
MKQKLFSNIVFLVIANLLVKPLWIFGIDLQVQNTVGAANYGGYFALFNFVFLLHIILDMGINQYHNREIAQHPEKLKEQFGKLLLFKAIFSFVYILATLGLAVALGFDDVWHLLGLLILNQILISVILFARSSFTAMQWYKWDAFFSIFDRVLAIAFCFILLQTNNFQILDFVYAQSTALIIAAIFSLIATSFNFIKLNCPVESKILKL